MLFTNTEFLLVREEPKIHGGKMHKNYNLEDADVAMQLRVFNGVLVWPLFSKEVVLQHFTAIALCSILLNIIMAVEEPKHHALSVIFNIFPELWVQMHLDDFFFFCKEADNPTDFRNNDLSSAGLYIKTAGQKQVMSL